MALYMYQASYTAKSMAAQLREPQDPVELIRPTMDELGAKIMVAGFPFGEYDVLVVYEAPDDMTAASVAMAIAAAGEAKGWRPLRFKMVDPARTGALPSAPLVLCPAVSWCGCPPGSRSAEKEGDDHHGRSGE